jgi:hypothetical protein
MTKEEHAELKARMQKAAGEETIDRVMKKFGVDVIVGTMEMMLVGFAALAGMSLRFFCQQKYTFGPRFEKRSCVFDV